jgi:cation diffusion facilitator family transporter
MSHSHSHSTHRSKDLQKITIIGAVTNLFLATLKIILGTLSNSAALLADGIHSLSDLISDTIIIFVSRLSSEEPDIDHPYGHNRFETIATLGLGVLLLIISIGIIWDASTSFLYAQPKPITNIDLIIAITLVSIISKEVLFWATLKVANMHNSEMIRANAWHHRSDALSSLVVLVGIFGVIMGYQNIDLFAAIVVGLMMMKMSYEFIAEPVKELVDTSIDTVQIKDLNKHLQKVEGVVDIHSLRTRKMGSAVHCDLHVQVNPFLSVSEGHMIAKNVSSEAKTLIPQIHEVTVHIDPEKDITAIDYSTIPPHSQLTNLIHSTLIDQDLGHALDNVRIHYLNAKYHVDIYLFTNKFTSMDELPNIIATATKSLSFLPNIGNIKVYFS